jgi:hypothetical protein
MFSPQALFNRCAQSIKTASKSHTPAVVLALQTQAFSTKKKPERGILFSAPCLDPEIRSAAEEHQALSDANPAKKIEKGILFSAPCLDFSRDGQPKVEKNQQNE